MPFLDDSGKLTPLVVAAMAAGATSSLVTTDHNQIILTFATQADRDAFAAKIDLAPQYRYWGVSSKPALTAIDIAALGNSEPATSFAKSITYDCTGGRFPYLAYPVAWGTPAAVTVGGLAFTDLVIADVPDADGKTIYRTIRFNYLQNGNAIRVVWA
nr:hypothetical protein [Sphingomonas populi]